MVTTWYKSFDLSGEQYDWIGCFLPIIRAWLNVNLPCELWTAWGRFCKFYISANLMISFPASYWFVFHYHFIIRAKRPILFPICYTSGFVRKQQALVDRVYRAYSPSIESPEKIKRHITNTNQWKVQQNCTRSFCTVHMPIYSSFFHGLIHISIHSHNTSHHWCITHASPIHHTLYQESHIHQTAS